MASSWLSAFSHMAQKHLPHSHPGLRLTGEKEGRATGSVAGPSVPFHRRQKKTNKTKHPTKLPPNRYEPSDLCGGSQPVSCHHPQGAHSRPTTAWVLGKGQTKHGLFFEDSQLSSCSTPRIFIHTEMLFKSHCTPRWRGIGDLNIMELQEYS